MTSIRTTDPRTGRSAPTDLLDTTSAGVDAAVADAVADAAALRASSRADRERLLRRIADEVRAARTELVDAAVRETGLSKERLDAELDRAANQFDLFAAVVRDGGYLEAMIDHAEGAAPDVRRMLVPIGPVVVFGASNFPFAFSVLGGDTASAIAAGCSVIAKAHPAHPITSALSAEVVRAAAIESVGLAVLHAIFGFEAGLDAVRHPDVRAVTLTGSLGAAKGILDAIAQRADPIPLFGELSSINPLIVFPRAAASRGDDIAALLFESFTASGGQLCTKPGYVFLPSGPDGDRMIDVLRARVESAPGAVLLSEGIRDHFVEGVARQEAEGARSATTRVAAPGESGFIAAPVLLEVALDELDPALARECFGPVIVAVRYDAVDGAVRAIAEFEPSLTISVHADADDDRPAVTDLLAVATERAGRIVFDGFPTGVRVSWAQHHGGPWPSTNSQHTSVGATAIRRFLRPLAFQNAPEWVLPRELHDAPADIPRRVDGRMTLA